MFVVLFFCFLFLFFIKFFFFFGFLFIFTFIFLVVFLGSSFCEDYFSSSIVIFGLAPLEEEERGGSTCL